MPFTKIIDSLFSKTGPLAQKFPGYEPREEQISMARTVAKAHADKEIVLIEAGTGTGKTFAYLIPALLAASKRNEKTIISTHTIALQEQLLEKDLPLLLDMLGLDLHVVLVKGMRNYLCLKRLKEASENALLSSQEENEELHSLNQFVQDSFVGCRSALNQPVSSATWEKVSVEKESCTQAACPHYKECYFFSARREIQDAHILIVNHHMLLTDLILKKQKDISSDFCILPKAAHLILDEAHHIENTAIQALTKRVGKLELLRLLARFFSENAQKLGSFALMRKKLLQEEVSPYLNTLLEVEIPAFRKQLADEIQNTFSLLSGFLNYLDIPGDAWGAKSKKWIFNPTSYGKHAEFAPLVQRFHELGSKLTQLCHYLHQLSDVCEERDLKESLKGCFFELEFVKERFAEASENIFHFFETTEDIKRIRSIEEDKLNISLLDTHLDIPKHLKEIVFSAFDSVMLCSATLTAGEEFSFLRKKLGLNPENWDSKVIQENIFASPFDYETQLFLGCPSDLPFPHEPSFEKEAASFIIDILVATKGGAFVLFTSYEMLGGCHSLIRKDPRLKNYPILVQGDGAKSALIKEFKETENAILLGTDTFWEGVDIPGKSLRCVILTKLPFKSPSDPFYQAYAAALQKEGKDPFMNHALPEACIKFKQGFGRLIRTKTDKGAVICLDKRLIQKAYGLFFIKSLPSCPKLFGPKETILEGLKKMMRHYG